MKLLIANDDGIDAEGLMTLYQSVKDLFDEVFVIAPATNLSASSMCLTIDRPLRIKKHHKEDFHYIDGSPVTCLHMAVNGFLPYQPDLVISGINHGPNLGDDVFYSGTVGIAQGAYLQGIPAIAFSLAIDETCQYGTAHFLSAGKVAREVVKRHLDESYGNHILLNVNIPNVPYEDILGYRAARLGRRTNPSRIIKTKDSRGQTHSWLGMPGMVDKEGDSFSETDFATIENRHVAITPLISDLTNFSMLEEVRTWTNNLGKDSNV